MSSFIFSYSHPIYLYLFRDFFFSLVPSVFYVDFVIKERVLLKWKNIVSDSHGCNDFKQKFDFVTQCWTFFMVKSLVGNRGTTHWIPNSETQVKNLKTQCRIYSRFSFSTGIWHFWYFWYKIDIQGFKKFQQKIKLIVSSGNWTHSTNHQWIRSQMPIPLCHPDMCWIEYP